MPRLNMCQRCRERVATRRLTDVYGQQIILCDLCADQTAAVQMVPINVLVPVVLAQPSMPVAHACPGCGLTLAHVNQTSHLGCSRCYAHFREALSATVRRMHGSSVHGGKRPGQIGGHPALPEPAPEPAVDRRERLRAELAQAVAEERFEEAAALRDQLRAEGEA